MQEKKERFHGIPMLPYGLLSAVMQESPGNRKEIQITEMAEEGFCFRTASAICSPQKLEVCFYDMERAEYGTVVITEFEICREKEEDFFTQFLVWTEQEEYRRQVQKLVRQYSKYIRLKLEDDGELESELTGYPSEFDGEHCSSLEEQRQYWFAEKAGRAEINMEIPEHTEFAIEFDCPERYTAYLQKSLPEFYHDYLRKNHLQGSGLEARIPDRIYIGNQFCHLLFPEEELLFAMLEKAKKEFTAVTLSFTYVREILLEDTFALLRKIDHWCSKNELEMECVVNDWGMADFIRKETKHLLPCLGTLLNKRKKDPRINYKKGERDLYSQNSFNADFYQEFLRESFGIERAEWESCGYMQDITAGKNSLHFPFYQTNTSQYCPLYAVQKEGDRGRQKLADKCPQYCKNAAFLYPKHLNMIGRYNSLFALDRDFLEDAEQLKRYTDSNIDRLVLNLL
ncbi:hypothetical protein [Blautia sp.]